MVGMDRCALKKATAFLWNGLLELLFPGVCEVCGRSLVKGEAYLCTACLADFPYVEGNSLPAGKVFAQLGETYGVSRCHSLFYYSKFSPYRRLVYLLKYCSYRRLGRFLGRMLGHRMLGLCRVDCIVPVPLHPARERERGYNQAAEIARGIADILHVEVVEDAVSRIRNNRSQTGMNAVERLENVSRAFRLDQGWKLSGRRVLLVDDVITTGATFCSCLSVLEEAGCEEILLASLGQTL